MHEAACHEANSFVTLTYDDAHLPPGGSLRPGDMVKFWKRLRAALGRKVRYFHCGEYGEQLGRPHHHALIFGFDFPDKVWLRGSGETSLWRSPFLESLWPFGHSSVGSSDV